MTRHPVPDQEAARTLGKALRSAGYSEDAVYRLLGDEAYAGDLDDVPADARRLPQTPLGAIVRLFFLQLPISNRDAVAALGEDAVEAIGRTGLADVEDEIAPRARIL